MISPDVQPALFPSMSAYESAKRPRPDVSRPGRSMLCSCEVSRDSPMKYCETTMPATPTGTFTKKIQFQPMLSTMRPPQSGPIASASAETPAQIDRKSVV